MSSFHSFTNYIKEFFPEYDPSNSQHKIKAEKILKAKAKLDRSLTSNDIELYFDSLNTEELYFDGYEKDKNLSNIIKDVYEDIQTDQMYVAYATDEQLFKFGNDFSAKFIDYIRKNIQDNNWDNLLLLTKYYSKLLSYEAENYLKEQIEDRNKNILPLISQHDRYSELVQYQYPMLPSFYKLQSNVDAIYFEDDINDINNQVADHQQTSRSNKSILGRILVALSHFETDDPELKTLLQKNAKIGAKWSKINENSWSKDKTLNHDNESSDPESDKKLSAKADWLIICVYFIVVGFIGYKIAYWTGPNFWYLVGAELVLYLILYKSLNKRYNANSTSQEPPSIRRSFKKFCFTSLLLQFYILIIGLILVLIAAAIGLIFVTKGFGIIILVLIYRWLKKK